MNQAPEAPSDPQPADGAVRVPRPVDLSVPVADPDGDPLGVTFYGRAAGETAFDQIDLLSGVSSGSNAASSWPLLAGGTYEWYVDVSDGSETTSSPVWSFTANTGPSDIQLSNAGVNENLPAGSTVGSLSATDVDSGDTHTFTLVSGDGSTGNSSFTIVSGSLRTAAAFNYETQSSYSVRIRATDLAGEDTEKVFQLSVFDLNEAPVAEAQSITLSEDTSQPITLSGTDEDGDGLGFSITAGPSHGELSGTPPAVTYTPAANYHGPDSFTFSASDGELAGSAVISLTIQPVNDAPAATAQSVSTNRNTARSITLAGTDVDGDTLTYSVVGQPAHGELSGSAPDLTYTPDLNYTGADSFTFKVNDGKVDSAPATVSITVNATNSAPTDIALSSTSVAENQPVNTIVATFSTTDPDVGETFEYNLVTGTGSAGNAQFNISGEDLRTSAEFDRETQSSYSIRVRSTDVLGASIEKVFTITVTNVNEAPVADNQTVNTDEDTPVAITLAGEDVDSSSLQFIVVSNPEHGSLNGTAANRTYTPAANYHGPDSFTFKINDGQYDSNTATVTINVASVNDVPTANPQSVTTAEDTAKSITLTGADVEGSLLTYSIVSGPDHGTLGTGNATRLYTPHPDYAGPDSFTFRTYDGTDYSEPALVSITVTPVNDAPTGISLSSSSLAENLEAVVEVGTLSTIDPDAGDSFTYSLVSGTGSTDNNSFTIHGSSLRTAHSFDYEDQSSYSIRVKTVDSGGLPFEEVLSISVMNVNEAPVGSPDTYTINEDSSLTVPAPGVLANDSDPEGDSLTAVWIGSADFGTALRHINGSLTYTPFPNRFGTETLRYMASDGSLSSAETLVTINVTAVNDAPVAKNIYKETPEDMPVTVLLDASDVDDDSLTWVIVDQPDHGTLSGTSPDLTYTPDPDYYGSDSFTYRANDGQANSNLATAYITVTFVNDAPVADNLSESTPENTPLAVALEASDQDGDPLTYEILSQPAHGKLEGSGSVYMYTPNLDYNGPDSFTFRVNDGQLNSNIALVSISVSSANSKPRDILLTAAKVLENLPAFTQVGLLSSIDPDPGDSFTYTLVEGTGSTDNAAFYITPSGGSLRTARTFNFELKDTYSIRVRSTDLGGLMIEKVFTITVEDANDAPIVDDRLLSGTEDVPMDIQLAGVDEDGDELTWSVGTPAQGSLTGSGDLRTYTPAADYAGLDSFTFTASDGTVSSTAKIVISLNAVNDAPVASHQSVSTNKNQALAIQLSGLDVDGDPLTFAKLTSPAHGYISGSGANLTYTPDLNYVGADSFTFKVSDGWADSAPATVSINVAAYSYPPTADEDEYEIDEDHLLTVTTIQGVLKNDFDIDSASLTALLVTNPAHGTLTLDPAGSFTYQPDLNWNGEDSFTYQASDGSLKSAVTQVTITVRPVNDVPLARSQSLTTLRDKPVQFVLKCTDADGDNLTWKLTSGPLHGTLTGTGGERVYTPAAGWTGTERIGFKANDGTVDSNLILVTIQVTQPERLLYLPLVRR